MSRLRLTNEMGFLETLKQKHVGKWIGLKGTDVVVVSDTHDEVLRKLRERHLDSAYVFYSPTENEKDNGFLFPVGKYRLLRESSSVE